ncbi:MAG: glycosyltransferase family 2 protein [Asticcacaulis sp.]|nr:glycosyltransferase family 2 protein [Asticcacaulis sp.]
MSCVVCAYNEADSLSDILRAIDGHPLFSEVIVVDDGSSDGTADIARTFPDVRVISYRPNRGKTHALSLGIEAASGDLIMLIDADLKGLKASNIFALAEPVLAGRARVSISLRANSLALYRGLGLDFVSGERVLPAALVKPYIAYMQRLPRWGAEAFINGLITRAKLPIAVIEWPDVFNIRKAEKIGAWRGALAELAMTADVFRVLTPVTVVQQNLAMLNLVSWRTARRRRLRPAPVALTQLRSLLFGEVR